MRQAREEDRTGKANGEEEEGKETTRKQDGIMARGGSKTARQTC
jgi:hypothetical protein